MKNIQHIVPMVFALALFSCASNPKTSKGVVDTFPEGETIENSIDDSALSDENLDVEMDGTEDDAVEVFEGDENAEELDGIDGGDESGEYEIFSEDDAFLDAENDSLEEQIEHSDEDGLSLDGEELLLEERVSPDDLPYLPYVLGADDDELLDEDGIDEIVDDEAFELPENNVIGVEATEDESESLGNLESNEGQLRESDVSSDVTVDGMYGSETEKTDESAEAGIDIDVTAANTEEDMITETDYKPKEPNENKSDVANTKADEKSDTISDMVGGEDAEDAKKRFDTLPTPSRSMTVKKGQTIEVVYPGRGWIYQENIDGDGNIDTRNRNFIFGGRRLGQENQAFTLRSRNPGTYLLHFYKNDALTEEYIDDYLEVHVEDESEPSSKTVVAPDYAAAIPPKPIINAENAHEIRESRKVLEEKQTAEEMKNGVMSRADSSVLTETQNADVGARKSYQNIPDSTRLEDYGAKTVVQTSGEMKNAHNATTETERNSRSKESEDDTDEVIDIAFDDEPIIEMSHQNDTEDGTDAEDSESLLEQAKKLYAEREYSKALEITRKFLDTAALRLDEALYLQAQILEAKSAVQNIRGAIDSYDEIVRNYPASTLWDAANKRSIYLKRFYIDIR